MGKRVEIDKEWLYQKYVEEGLSCKDIAKLINVSEKTINNRLHEYNIPLKK